MTKGKAVARVPKSVDVAHVPELLSIAEKVRETGESCILKRGRVEIAILSPVPAAPRKQRKTGVVTRNDPLWNIVGMASSEDPGEVARNKHKYLAEAYATKRA